MEIEVQIDTLTLPESVDAATMGVALEAELARLFRERGTPATVGTMAQGSVVELSADALRVDGPVSAVELGQALARTLYATLGGESRSP